jgi:GTPase SAR1 family protein
MATNNGKQIMITVAGPGEAGKTKLCLCLKDPDAAFNPSRAVTNNFDMFMKNIVHRGTEYQLTVWDTPGKLMANVQSMTSAFNKANIVFVAFDVNSQDNMDILTANISGITVNHRPDLKFYLIGCKSDLPKAVSESSINELMNIPVPNEGKLFSGYIECSAARGYTCTKMLEKVLDEYIHGTPTQEQKAGQSNVIKLGDSAGAPPKKTSCCS